MKFTTTVLCLAIVLGISSLVSCSEADWKGPKYQGYPLLTPNKTGTLAVKLANGTIHHYDKADSGILILNDSNIDQAKYDFKHLIVNWFSKWCTTWCVLFHPYYIKAHDIARQKGLNVQFAQMEWNDNKKTITKYGVTTHPVQILFVHGKANPIEYKGSKGYTPLIDWLTSQLNTLAKQGY